MFLTERVEESEELDIAVEKCLRWPLISSLLMNNVSVKAVYGELKKDVGEVRVATDLEKTLLEYDIIITLDPEETKVYEEIDYIAVIAHLLRTVEVEFRRDKPVITIQRESYYKIDIEVVKHFGKDHYAYQTFFSGLEGIKDDIPGVTRERVKRPMMDVQVSKTERKGM